MKTFIAISIIQLAAILLLYAEITNLDDSLQTVLAAEQQPVSVSDVTRLPTSDDANAGVINEDRLRQIIREELVAHVENGSLPESQVSRSVASATVDPLKMEARREQISQQLEYYVSVGRISDAEMQKLQIDIAKLDADGRTEMLRELTRALNSGRLEGRL